MSWGPPDWSSAPEGYSNSLSFKICTKLPTPEGCLFEEHEGKNGQLGTYASPKRAIDSGASYTESAVRPVSGGVKDGDADHDWGPIKSEA